MKKGTRVLYDGEEAIVAHWYEDSIIIEINDTWGDPLETFGIDYTPKFEDGSFIEVNEWDIEIPGKGVEIY